MIAAAERKGLPNPFDGDPPIVSHVLGNLSTTTFVASLTFRSIHVGIWMSKEHKNKPLET